MHLHAIEAVLGAATVLAVPAALIGLAGDPAPGFAPGEAETVEIAATTTDYQLPGEFLADGRPANAPIEKRAVPAFRIMKQQVSLAEYNRCAAEDACLPASASTGPADIPVTGVNWIDARAYARWYSKATGQTWRLPTALEISVAAAERHVGDSYSAVADDPANPAVRWLRVYQEEAAANRIPDPTPKERGHFGPNSIGIEDFGGNVWEWTSTCYERVTLAPDGSAANVLENCGVYVMEGQHRAYMSSFVREGKSGGCAVGTPPDNLGFRLVREEPSLLARVKSAFGAMLAAGRPDA